MTDPEQDEVFEAYLQRRPVLPAPDDKIEPPAALDQLVLSQARDAIRPPAAPQRPPRWAVPMALAAIVLLCLSIAINISLNTNRPKEVILTEAKVVGAPAPHEPVVAEA